MISNDLIIFSLYFYSDKSPSFHDPKQGYLHLGLEMPQPPILSVVGRHDIKVAPL